MPLVHEMLDRMQNAFRIEADCLQKQAEAFDPAAYTAAVELLRDAPRIGTCGCGHSGIACRHLAHLLCCVERPARFISPAEAVHGATGFLQKGDVMVFASRGGKTAELLPILRICRERGVRVVTVTAAHDSPLAQGADVVLRQVVTRETDRHGDQGTTSTTSLCAVFHALQAGLIEITGFQKRQFGVIHPGGAVGERLHQTK